jgi:hypothetical protein
MRDLSLIKKFLEEKPDEFGLMKALELIFSHSTFEANTNKLGNTYRKYSFVLPDSLFFNYFRGFRSCHINERVYSGQISIQVLYGTIDDSSMTAWIHVQSEADMRLVFDKLIKILHVDEEHPKRIAGFSYFDIYQKFDDYAELLIQWESDFSLLLEDHIRPLCPYHVVYDYN